MKVKKKHDVFVVPKNKLWKYLFLKGWVDSLSGLEEVIEVKMTDDGVEFTFCRIPPWPKGEKPQRAKLIELKARVEKALQAIWNRAKNGEIDALEATALAEREPHSDEFTVLTFKEDEILNVIQNMRFPSFWGSLLKAEAWVDPSAYRKITKVELTDDDIEFTIAKTRVP